jgi:hypothetical protein
VSTKRIVHRGAFSHFTYENALFIELLRNIYKGIKIKCGHASWLDESSAKLIKEWQE